MCVVEVLQAEGLRPAIGGSGLLVAHGLSDVANDWDVTLDAAPSTVTGILSRADVQYSDGTYASDRSSGNCRRYIVNGGDHQVDVVVNFSLRAPTGPIPLPARVTGHWRGLPLADPVVWARAYRLLGKPNKAELLEHWLNQQSR